MCYVAVVFESVCVANAFDNLVSACFFCLYENPSLSVRRAAVPYMYVIQHMSEPRPCQLRQNTADLSQSNLLLKLGTLDSCPCPLGISRRGIHVRRRRIVGISRVHRIGGNRGRGLVATPQYHLLEHAGSMYRVYGENGPPSGDCAAALWCWHSAARMG
jgi:hypothetical protein